MPAAFPDFETITFLPPGQQASTSGTKTDLNRFFAAIVKCEKLEVGEQDFEHFFIDLMISKEKLNWKLMRVLREALLYYISVWPGWQRNKQYFSGQLSYKAWFERFRQYLIFKSNFIVKNVSRFSDDVENVKDATVQTDFSNKSIQKRLAPYTLIVGGPPAVLNNVVFLENKGNILVKQHIEKPWKDLEMSELLNWPHVSVEVRLPDISISRTNTHEWQRFVALGCDVTAIPEVSSIKHIKRTSGNENCELQPFTYAFIEGYVQQLNQLLTKIPNISDIRRLELKTIFAEFLADIKEVGVYNTTMCPNISIGYHIGKNKYIRNKKMVSTDLDKTSCGLNVINFYEVLMPQVDFVLHHFKTTQDTAHKSGVAFQTLNKIFYKLLLEKAHQEIADFRFLVNNTCVVYNCTLCVKNFSGPHAHFNLTKHFAQHHKAEQSVLCHKCRRQFDVKTLAGSRWTHICK